MLSYPKRAINRVVLASYKPRFFFSYPHGVRPAFICGCGHTGTTILFRILTNHPKVYGPPYETAAFVSDDKWRRLHRLFAEAKSSAKPVLIEKTPRHIHAIDNIRDVLPGAKFILTVRDGYDVAASIGRRTGDYREGALRWVSDTSIVAANLSEPDTILFRYEDFVADPAGVVSDLCEFIGLDYSRTMLDYHERPINWRGGSNRPPRTDHEHRRAQQFNAPVFDGRGKGSVALPTEGKEVLASSEASKLLRLFGYK